MEKGASRPSFFTVIVMGGRRGRAYGRLGNWALLRFFPLSDTGSYTTPVGAELPFWTDTLSPVPVTNGQFSVTLGATPAKPLDPAKFGGETYIGIKVGGQLEMTPRQKMTSVPYAFNGIPKGGIIMWSGTTAPVGWALCNGDNGTPDLREKFIMGSSSSYQVTSTGGVSAINLSHVHSGTEHNHPGANHNHAGADHTHWDDHIHSGNTSTNGDITSITHGNNQAQGRDHSHSFSTNSKSAQGYGGTTQGADRDLTTGYSNQNLTTGNAGTGNTGGALGSNQSILPPYYALAFIMKL